MTSDELRLAAEDARRHWNSLDTALIEAIKACLVLNGGSAVATLGLLQAVLTRGPNSTFKWCALLAVLIFLVGTFCVVTAFGHRSSVFRSILVGDKDTAVQRDIKSTLWIAAAMAAFIGGCFVVGLGIALAL